MSDKRIKKESKWKPLEIYAVVCTEGGLYFLSHAYPHQWKSQRECREYVNQTIPMGERQFYRVAKLVEVRP